MGEFTGKTVFITGASRGIGKAIGLKLASEGANVVIAAKTAEPHPKLPGTVYTAAEEMEAAGGKALATVVDIRDEAQVDAAVAKAVETFGGIDAVVNNASAIALTGTLETPMKRYDLMHSVNARGTYLVTQKCLPHLLEAENPHILCISPPLNMDPKWFRNHAAYTQAKYGMSVYAMAWAAEFAKQGRTTIDTAAIKMVLGEKGQRTSRLPTIMADAAFEVLRRPARECTGNFFVDEDLLREAGKTDFAEYRHEGVSEEELTPDYFL
jgi:citronellol/citronellal dehydrogenase